MDIKDVFFDRPKVMAMADRETRKALGRMGGFIRVTARRSMRPGGKKGKSSPPGQPPRYHTKDKTATLRNILYGYDPLRQAVIVGPVGLNQRVEGSVDSIPQLHERGGVLKPSRRQRRRGDTRLRRYPARPFMAPALAKVPGRFPEIWYGKNISADAA